MTGLLLLAALAAGRAPASLTVASVRGEVRVPVRAARDGAPLLPARLFLDALGGSLREADGWAEVALARQQFRFLVGTPYVVFNGRVQPLVAATRVERDSLWLPYQFAVEVLPRLLSERYRYDPDQGRLVDAGWQLVRGGGASGPRRRGAGDGDGGAPAPRLATGLRRAHLVTVDPGHGGVDPGNPGVFFPRGIREKDVTLQVGLLLREELRRRGIGVRMTRARDTLIALGDRGGYCAGDCDLFVSLHVNSLPKRAGYTAVNGFETYFLSEAKTEDAQRVAKMENEAVRFETGAEQAAQEQGLDFILKDLALNEHLRESARVAELVQGELARVHTGEDRGVKQAGFMVLTTARRPAVLVEMGYSTSPRDGRLLTERASQKKLAAAIADAIVAYLAEYEKKTADAVPAGAP